MAWEGCPREDESFQITSFQQLAIKQNLIQKTAESTSLSHLNWTYIVDDCMLPWEMSGCVSAQSHIFPKFPDMIDHIPFYVELYV